MTTEDYMENGKITDSIRIAVIGLGYVGLPLARLFSTKFRTIGYDTDKARTEALSSGHDGTLEVDDRLLKEAITAHGLVCTSDITKIRECNFYVVAVPTPVDINHNPDLTPLRNASRMLGTIIKKGDIVVFESTVYPGVTEEECVPIIEEVSGLEYNTGFFAGYSPERVNPGDKEHTVENIRKITSGSTPEVADIVDKVYSEVLENGTYRASSVNELSKIFSLMGIDTLEVLDAAATKWNFIKMNPGLVGGHCISVDPYYLAQCAQRHGYNPEIILAGRRVNDSMGAYVANQTIKLMLKKGIQVLKSKVIIMGFTFKENCPDVRNTKIIDIYRSLQEYNVDITVYDPWASKDVVRKVYGIDIVDKLPSGKFDAAIVAVAHGQFRRHEVDMDALLNPVHVIYDVKGILPREIVDGRL